MTRVMKTRKRATVKAKSARKHAKSRLDRALEQAVKAEPDRAGPMPKFGKPKHKRAPAVRTVPK